ncbi:MAG: nitronate monooxygenase [Desulfovibrio sp.]|nr:MAG: nitronate monooxygenase [Desulfovibrio sp.]
MPGGAANASSDSLGEQQGAGYKPPRLRIRDLSVELPIIQGGMGIGVSLSGLASAVARAGGVGVIATAGIGWDEPDFHTKYKSANNRALRRHIRAVREAGPGVLGVNILVALSNYNDLVTTAVEENVDLIISGAGLPLALPELVPPDGPKLVPIVSSARAAEIICKKWKNRYDRLPDAFVVEGPKAGGHLGFKAEDLDQPEFALEKILVPVVETARKFGNIPVIAAGGVYTGADIHAMLQLGASGCQMGTRFVGTEECDASPEFKQHYLSAKAEDIQIVQSPVGLPGRAIRTPFVKDLDGDSRQPESCPFYCMRGCKKEDAPFCITRALIEAKTGNLQDGLVFAGSNAWRVDSIVPVARLMADLVAEYEAESRRHAQTQEAEPSPLAGVSGL